MRKNHEKKHEKNGKTRRMAQCAGSGGKGACSPPRVMHALELVQEFVQLSITPAGMRWIQVLHALYVPVSLLTIHVYYLRFAKRDDQLGQLRESRFQGARQGQL